LPKKRKPAKNYEEEKALNLEADEIESEEEEGKEEFVRENP
jgi:hypothetical protein